jgi:hypothetical protein
VPQQTHEAIKRQIRGETERHIASYRHRGSRAIRRRLAELDREWDIERTLESNAAVVSLIGLVLGRFVDRRWYLLPGFVAAFLLQHAVQGWCPPLLIFRRMGVRTARKIDHERNALKALRGDFNELSQDGQAARDMAPRHLLEIMER